MTKLQFLTLDLMQISRVFVRVFLNNFLGTDSQITKLQFIHFPTP